MLKRPLPLHTRLALGYGAFFALVLTLLGVGVYLTVQSALLSQMRHELQTSSDLFNWATPIGMPIADRPDLRAGWETMAGSANTDNCLPHPLSESDRR